MKEKLYYTQLDVLKFLCCIGVVAIHTRPFAYYPLVEQHWVNRHLPVWVGLLLFAAMSFTPLILTLAGLPTEFGFFQLGLSVLVAPLPLQIGYMASRGQLRCMAIGGGSC